MLQQQIAAVAYGCVAAGAGIRIPPKRLLLSERLRSAVHRAAPKALIAFNTARRNYGDAAARWLKADGLEGGPAP